MPLDANTWKAVVRRKSSKSQVFKELDDAVRDYLADLTSTDKLTTLKAKWNAWIAGLANKDYKNSDRYVAGSALDDLALLCAATTPSSAPGIQRMVSDSELASLLAARESRVIVRQTANLIFQMTGPTPMPVNMPLRYNLRKTGRGMQDAEILVELPILVHEGAAAKNYWISQNYAADDFDRTVHQGKKPGVVGANAGPDVLRNWTKAINDWWAKAAVIHHPTGGQEKYYRLKFEFTFTDDPAKACKQVCCVETTGDAATVNPTGTIDAVRWGVKDSGPGGPICHEVGHFLGCPDEYYTITYDKRRKDWGAGYQPDAGVMNNPDTAPFPRHYRKMGQELAAQFGFNPDDSSIILDVTLLMHNTKQRRHALSGHIWDGISGVSVVP